MAINNIVTATLISLLITIGGVTANAVEKDREHPESHHGTTGHTEEMSPNSPVQTTSQEGTSSSTQTKRSLSERTVNQNEQVKQKRAEFEARMKQRQDEVRTKLEGKKLQMCQNRQSKINELLSKSTEIGKAHLTRLQGFEEGIKKFYVNEELSAEGYEVALANVDEKEAAAVAALDVMNNQTFECSAVDASKPADGIRQSAAEKRNALRAYRDAIVEFVQIVRKAHHAKVTSAQTTTNSEGAN